MELSISGQMRRTERIANNAPQAERRPAALSLKGTRTDKLALSQGALSYLQELNRQEREQQQKLLEAKRRGGDEVDALTRNLKIMEKCRKIAARIQAGDKVPPEDERYLMDHDADSYKLALALRKPKEKPREWDSVLEDEDRESSSGEGDASASEAVSSEGSGAPAESM